ncbi:MAG: RNA polymerase sigma factor [Myxococcales bacterium]|nr:RNA polymerase sigma factor [Myxococcales bacterium]
MDCDPAVLRQRALDKDPDLIEDLFACFQQDLLRFMRQRCGNVVDAQDAVQDAFEAGVRYLEGYRGDASLKNWLYRLAASACSRMRRGQKNDPGLHEPLLESGASMAEALGQQAEAMLAARMLPLREVLSALTPTDRAVLLLRDGEGLSTTEAAQELGISEAALKSRLQRTRAMLRAKLGE